MRTSSGSLRKEEYANKGPMIGIAEMRQNELD